MTGKKSIALITVLVVAAILVVVNYLVGALSIGNARLDLTENKLYTLSEGTKKILNAIPNGRKVSVRYYVTKDSRVMPGQLETHSRNVRDMLKEMVAASDGKLEIEEFNPMTDTEDEDKATADEIQGIRVSETDSIYLGLAVQSLQQKEIIPFLNPQEETRLEYELARSIRKVTSPKRPVVGVLSSLPVAGPPFFMPGQQQQQPWVFYQFLKRDYDVRSIEENTEKIEDDVKVLLVFHPAGLPETTEYAIDQYLLRGGNVIVFADSHSFVAERSQPANPMTGQPGGQTFSSLRRLFPNWGVEVDAGQVLVDMTYASPRGPIIPMLPAEAMNHSDIATASLENLEMILSGAVTMRDVKDLKKSVLISSSLQSEMMDQPTAMSQLQSGQFNNFVSGNKNLPLAVRITGTFHTAFPQGKPAPPPPSPQGGPGGLPPGFPGFDGTGGQSPQDGEAPAPEAPAPEAPAPEAPALEAPAPEAPATRVPGSGVLAPEALAPETATPPDQVPAEGPAVVPDPDFITVAKNPSSNVIVIADVDMLADPFCSTQDQLGNIMMINQNLAFLGNMVEQLAEGSLLVDVRSRASSTRPFTRIQELEAQVNEKYRPRLDQISRDISEVQEKIGGIQMKEEGGTVAFLLTEEQQSQLQDLRSKLANIETEEGKLRKEQRSQIESMKNWIKAVNVAGIPLAVILIGLIVGIFRYTSTSAR